MSCDYHKRVDFRAFDVMVDAITNCTPADLDRAIETCREFACGPHSKLSERLIWRRFENLLRLYRRKFGS